MEVASKLATRPPTRHCGYHRAIRALNLFPTSSLHGKQVGLNLGCLNRNSRNNRNGDEVHHLTIADFSKVAALESWFGMRYPWLAIISSGSSELLSGPTQHALFRLRKRSLRSNGTRKLRTSQKHPQSFMFRDSGGTRFLEGNHPALEGRRHRRAIMHQICLRSRPQH